MIIHSLRCAELVVETTRMYIPPPESVAELFDTLLLLIVTIENPKSIVNSPPPSSVAELFSKMQSDISIKAG